MQRRFVYRCLVMIPLIVNLLVMISCGNTYPKKVEKKYASGSIRERYYVNESGRLDGQYELYYEFGMLKATSQYKDGKKEGASKTYFRSGRMESSVEYRNDLPVGRAQFNYESDYIRKEEHYDEQSQLVQTKSYYPNGMLMYHGAFRLATGEPYAFKTLTKNRQVIPEQSYFVAIRKTGGRSFRAQLYHPDGLHYDSIRISVVRNVRPENWEDLEVLRSMIVRSNPFHVEMEEEDFTGYKIGYLILAYGKDLEGNPRVHEFRMHWNKSESIPTDNIRPLF